MGSCSIRGCKEPPYVLCGVTKPVLCMTHWDEFEASKWGARQANGAAAAETALGYWFRERTEAEAAHGRKVADGQ